LRWARLASLAAAEGPAGAKLLLGVGLTEVPLAEKAAVIDSCDMTAPSRAAKTWGLSGLVAGEFT
jgi:hypothetical protein